MYNYNKVYCVKILATSDKNVQSYLDIKNVRPKTFFSWSIRNSFIYRKCSYKSPIFINYILFTFNLEFWIILIKKKIKNKQM